MRPAIRRLRPHIEFITLATLALVVVAGTAWNIYLTMVVGVFAAAIVAFTVTAEYLILVPMKNNPGAKRLVGLLAAVDLLLGLTIFRYFFRDIPLSREALVLLFWGLFASLAYLGWHIWRDQFEGARQYRRNHQKAEREQ